MAKAEPKFETEAELCAAFIEDMKTQRGWIVYPETAGFDILLVREDTGHQLGVQAKLALNAKVADQICPWSYDNEGPDWRGVLVPKITEASYGIARMLGHLGVMTFRPRMADVRYRNGQWTEVWRFDVQHPGYGEAWHDWNPVKRCALPEIVPTVAAGVPSPIQLTPWKIGALKVLAALEVDGFVTAEQVRTFGVNHRRFCASDGWLTSLGDGKWGIGKVPRFDIQHPEAYAEILAAARDRAVSPKHVQDKVA